MILGGEVRDGQKIHLDVDPHGSGLKFEVETGDREAVAAH
jgi:hypothetical protein